MAATKNSSSSNTFAHAWASWVSAAPEITRKNLAVANACGKAYANLGQAMAKQAQQVTQDSLAQMSFALKDLIGTHNPTQRVSKQMDLAKKAFQHSVENTGSTLEMLAKSNREVANIVTRRACEIVDETREQIEKVQAA